MAIDRAIETWERVVADFLEGRTFLPRGLDAWRASYRGRREGAVELQAFPEPYLGGLEAGRVRAVFLALNPGRADLTFQSRTGIFADEIRRMGSYRAWAASWPYLRDPWDSIKGRNRHHRARLAFLRRWFEDPELTPDRMVHFELYPWHSTKVNAVMRPPVEVVRRFIWEPTAELGCQLVFAFGSPWFEILPRLGVQPVEVLGVGGAAYGSRVRSRSVLVGRADLDLWVIAEKHTGSAGPPSSSEVAVLREAVERAMSSR